MQLTIIIVIVILLCLLSIGGGGWYYYYTTLTPTTTPTPTTTTTSTPTTTPTTTDTTTPTPTTPTTTPTTTDTTTTKPTLTTTPIDTILLPEGKKGIEWGFGGSKIYDDGSLRIESDDIVYTRINGKNVVTTTSDGINVDSGKPLFTTVNFQNQGSLFRNGDKRSGDGGPKMMTLRNGDGSLRLAASTNEIQAPFGTYLHFGTGYEKEVEAGKIGYGIHDGGAAGTLNIVGGGKTGQERGVRIYDKLHVGTWEIQEINGEITFLKNGVAKAGVKDSGEVYSKAGILFGSAYAYQLTTPGAKNCVDSGSLGQTCDWTNPNKRFYLWRSPYTGGK